VLTLKQNGIENAAALLGGYDGWKSSGGDIEKGKSIEQ